MIKLPKPQILIDNGYEWTKEYLSSLKTGKKIASKYNHPQIKTNLKIETNDKCAYCESKLSHSTYGDVEHILPKNKNAKPELYVEWDNLTIACELCNRSGKRDYYDPLDPIINPYSEDAESFLVPCGAFILPKLDNRKGHVSVSILKLNRSELLEKRTEKINSINALISTYQNEANLNIKEVLKEQILIEASVDKEYSFIVNGMLKSIGII